METEKKTKAEAIELLKMWADYLEVPTDTEGFEGAIETLALPVMNKRLDFDETKEVFLLKLVSPLEMETSKIEMVTIRELALNEKRCVEKYKDSEKISMAEAIYAKSCGLKLAEASRLKGRDFSVVVAINSVFFS